MDRYLHLATSKILVHIGKKNERFSKCMHNTCRYLNLILSGKRVQVDVLYVHKRARQIMMHDSMGEMLICLKPVKSGHSWMFSKHEIIQQFA